MNGTSLLHNAINAHAEVNKDPDKGSNAASDIDDACQLRDITVRAHPGSIRGNAAGEQGNQQDHEHGGDNLQEPASGIVAGIEDAHT